MSSTFSLFGPGVRLMRHLRIPVKMALLGLLLLMPLALLMTSTYRSARADMAFANSEMEGRADGAAPVGPGRSLASASWADGAGAVRRRRGQGPTGRQAGRHRPGTRRR